MSSFWVWSLAPAHGKYVWDSLTAPDTPGTYYYGVCADVVPLESNTANNCSASTQVTVREAPPTTDIAFASVSVDPASPAAGGLFALEGVLRNAGKKTTAGFWVRFYRSDDATFTAPGPEVGSQWVWGMFSKGTQWVGKILDTPDERGTYYYRICADAAAGESDTSNNCSAAVAVKVTHKKPNLRITGWGVGHWRRDGTFPVHATVRNYGGPSPATTMRFYRSTDQNFQSPPGTEVSAVAVPALEKQDSGDPPWFLSPRQFMTRPPSPGRWCYRACVDAVAGESDTTDNCSKTIHCAIW